MNVNVNANNSSIVSSGASGFGQNKMSGLNLFVLVRVVPYGSECLV